MLCARVVCIFLCFLFSAVCYLSAVVGSVFFVDCCAFRLICCVFRGVRCLLSAACCVWSVACDESRFLRCLLCVSELFVVSCLIFVVSFDLCFVNFLF